MSALHDLDAERQLLAIALSGHPTIRDMFLTIPAGVWEPRHEPIATVLRDRLTREIPIDPGTIATDSAKAVGTDERANRMYKFVLDCSATAPPMASWSYYLERVLTCHAIRETAAAGQRLTQRAETAEELADIADHIRATQTDLDTITSNLTARATEPPLSLQDILDSPEQPHDWLVPNLWERGDRIILTGYEGTGKSMLLAQFALTVAAGLHPFAADPYQTNGNRVLALDCENSVRQIRRRYRGIVGKINLIRERHALPAIDWSQHLRFVLRPEGIDLTDITEYARLEQAIATTAPDLVVAGPLYRLHKMNINDEQAARELVDALDRLRTKYRFTLICEAHVGHIGEAAGGRKLRPTGSSLFLRWPEFGYGIRADPSVANEEHPSLVEMVAWRGAREERAWPDMLRHDQYQLPWMPPNLRYLDRHMEVTAS